MFVFYKHLVGPEVQIVVGVLCWPGGVTLQGSELHLLTMITATATLSDSPHYMNLCCGHDCTFVNIFFAVYTVCFHNAIL